MMAFTGSDYTFVLDDNVEGCEGNGAHPNCDAEATPIEELMERV